MSRRSPWSGRQCHHGWPQGQRVPAAPRRWVLLFCRLLSSSLFCKVQEQWLRVSRPLSFLNQKHPWGESGHEYSSPTPCRCQAPAFLHSATHGSSDTRSCCYASQTPHGMLAPSLSGVGGQLWPCHHGRGLGPRSTEGGAVAEASSSELLIVLRVLF